ncbi:MAG: DUF1624 domain-containing protein, partial [Chitinophagaceae bacterium]|nr:DUF1624 domain-containing protein [Chitinophagaceae bacterium]
YHFVKTKPGFSKTLYRTLVLFGIAYFLNIAKFQLPVLLGIMPQNFIQEIIPLNYPPILIGDILHTAALSLPILCLLNYSAKSKLIISCMLLVMICTYRHLVIPEKNTSPLVFHFMQLSIGKPPLTYFPLLPWISFVVMGFFAASVISKIGEQWLWSFIPFGAFIMSMAKLLGTSEPTSVFYTPLPFQLIKHIGFIFCWVGIWHLCTPYIKHSTAGRLLIFCSRNLTSSYCIQWPLICLLIPLLGFHSMNIIPAFMTASTITAITFSITALITRTKSI